jgi:hypothetical protein
MGQFKPMVKMDTTEPSVELKLKTGGSASFKRMHSEGAKEGFKPVKKMNGGVMDALSRTPTPTTPLGNPTAARAMASKRPPMRAPAAPARGMPAVGRPAAAPMPAAPMGRPMMKKGGDVSGALEKHADMPASKAHKGLKTGGIAKSTKPGAYATGGVVNGQGGFKKGGAIAKSGIINTEDQGGQYRNTKMDTAKPDNNSAPTGDVKLGNAGGYKKGGAAKKRYATGGAVNNSGHAVAYPAKKPSAPVSNDRQSGTFKKGGSVTPAEKKLQSNFKAENATAMKQAKAQSNLKYQSGGKVTDLSKGAYDKSIGPSDDEMAMAKTIRNIPSKLYEGAKSLLTGMGAPSKKEQEIADKAGSVTKTEKSVTVSPAKKRGGSVKC